MDCIDPVVAGLEMMEQLGDTEELQPSRNTCQFDGWQPEKTEEPWYIGKYVEPMW